MTSPSCCGRFQSGRRRSGLRRVGLMIGLLEAMSAVSSKRYGPPIVKAPTHRHSGVKSFTYRAVEPSHSPSRRSTNKITASEGAPWPLGLVPLTSVQISPRLERQRPPIRRPAAVIRRERGSVTTAATKSRARQRSPRRGHYYGDESSSYAPPRRVTL
jgi:hypothetical protein